MHLAEFLPPLIACGVYLILYRRRARTLAFRGAPIEVWRQVSFSSGVALLAIVQIGPLDTLADQVLVAHAIQHIVIGDICSLLIVLGLTGPMLAPLLRIRMTRPIRRLAGPVTAFGLWVIDLYIWHLPLLYQLAIRHDLVHALEHACLLWFGTLMWLALIGPLPKPDWFAGWNKLSYIIAVRFAGAVLANVLIWTQSVLYPIYRTSDAARGLRPLSDQNLAGGVMMVEQILLTTSLLGWLFYRALARDQERQELVELAARQGRDITPERAARAADAGAGEHLRRRLLETDPRRRDRHADPAADRTPPRDGS